MRLAKDLETGEVFLYSWLPDGQNDVDIYKPPRPAKAQQPLPRPDGRNRQDSRPPMEINAGTVDMGKPSKKGSDDHDADRPQAQDAPRPAAHSLQHNTGELDLDVDDSPATKYPIKQKADSPPVNRPQKQTLQKKPADEPKQQADDDEGGMWSPADERELARLKRKFQWL